MQVREAELYRGEVSGVQRRRLGGEARPQRQYILWVRKLSEVQVHVGAQANCRKMPDLRQRISGGEKPESRTSNRLSEQRVRLRTARAATRGGSNYRVISAFNRQHL